MDEESAHKSEPSQSNSAGPEDGRIDFSNYSIEQLRELQFNVDKVAFPLLHADVTYTFRNGIYVNTREEKVYRYGIFKTPASHR